jgi:hypothetical protein
MNSVLDWLNELSQWPGDNCPEVLGKNSMPRVQVICALLKMDAGGYGIITGGTPPYGRKGLYMEESWILATSMSFLQGWLSCDPTQESIAKQALEEERLRILKLTENSG